MKRKQSRFSFRQREDTHDLGFGSRVIQQSHKRLINRDGSFNVSRTGLPFFRSLNLYHTLVTMSWSQFFLLLVGFYFGVNLLFAFGYFLCGPGALYGTQATEPLQRFLETFFFSVQTLATIGYGSLAPSGFAANLLVTFQALAGGLGFAVSTGLVFARFSRPTARIVFSENAVIAPYNGITAFEFRIVNTSSNELVDVKATVALSWLEEAGDQKVRRFHELKLERQEVKFFPLHWILVHPIDETSPLKDATAADLSAADAEFLILLSAVDETSFQAVHARSSYKFDEIVWGARFRSMFTEGGMKVDLRKLHDIEIVNEPA